MRIFISLMVWYDLIVHQHMSLTQGLASSEFQSKTQHLSLCKTPRSYAENYFFTIFFFLHVYKTNFQLSFSIIIAKTMNRYKNIKRCTDFLQLDDNSFILWRLSPTKEQDEEWETFISWPIRNLRMSLGKQLLSATAYVSTIVYTQR